jgi:hypothetical protein
MKKVFALLSVASVLAFASCGEKAVESSNVDSLATDTTETVVPAAADTTADSTAVVDTTAKK